jgi:hypothetical protein
MGAKTSKDRHPPREWPPRATEFKSLLIVELDSLVVFTIEQPKVDVTVIRREVVVEGDPGVR